MIPNYIAKRSIDIPLRSPGVSPIVEGPSGLGNPLFESTEDKESHIFQLSDRIYVVELDTVKY